MIAEILIGLSIIFILVLDYNDKNRNINGIKFYIMSFYKLVQKI